MYVVSTLTLSDVRGTSFLRSHATSSQQKRNSLIGSMSSSPCALAHRVCQVLIHVFLKLVVMGMMLVITSWTHFAKLNVPNQNTPSSWVLACNVSTRFCHTWIAAAETKFGFFLPTAQFFLQTVSRDNNDLGVEKMLAASSIVMTALDGPFR